MRHLSGRLFRGLCQWSQRQFSPLLAMALGAVVYLVFRSARLRLGITKEMCLCVGVEEQIVPLAQPDGVFAAQALPQLSAAVAEPVVCTQRYAGRVLGVNAGRLLDTLHFLSAGAVSFARGLNDTPKMAALLLVAGALDLRWGWVAVAVAIGLGGLLGARHVAETMSHRITGIHFCARNGTRNLTQDALASMRATEDGDAGGMRLYRTRPERRTTGSGRGAAGQWRDAIGNMSTKQRLQDR